MQRLPTKRPLVALMKQARAFGVGVVVATQNPMDLDSPSSPSSSRNPRSALRRRARSARWGRDRTPAAGWQTSAPTPRVGARSRWVSCSGYFAKTCPEKKEPRAISAKAAEKMPVWATALVILIELAAKDFDQQKSPLHKAVVDALKKERRE